MPHFLELTLPKVGSYPPRPIMINPAHVHSITQNYVVHPEDRLRPEAEKRRLLDGSVLATGPGCDDYLIVVEDYDDVVRRLQPSLPTSDYTL